MNPTPKEVSTIILGIEGVLSRIKNKDGKKPSIKDFINASVGVGEKQKSIFNTVIQYGKQAIVSAGMINIPANKSFLTAHASVSQVLPVCLMHKNAVGSSVAARNEIKQALIDGFEAINKTTASASIQDSLETSMRQNMMLAFHEQPDLATALMEEAEQDFCAGIKQQIVNEWLGNSVDKHAANDFDM